MKSTDVRYYIVTERIITMLARLEALNSLTIQEIVNCTIIYMENFTLQEIVFTLAELQTRNLVELKLIKMSGFTGDYYANLWSLTDQGEQVYKSQDWLTVHAR